MFQILVVEDNENLNQTVCTYLNLNGYQAKGVLNVNDAYDVMTDHIFDLIISTL